MKRRPAFKVFGMKALGLRPEEMEQMYARVDAIRKARLSEEAAVTGEAAKIKVGGTWQNLRSRRLVTINGVNRPLDQVSCCNSIGSIRTLSTRLFLRRYRYKPEGQTK